MDILKNAKKIKRRWILHKRRLLERRNGDQNGSMDEVNQLRLQGIYAVLKYDYTYIREKRYQFDNNFVLQITIKNQYDKSKKQ